MTQINNIKELNENFQSAIEPKTVQNTTEWVTQIFDAHCEIAN